MAIIPTPSQIYFGQFVGRFADIIGDTTADVDHLPEFIPVAGTVTFTPEIPGTGLKIAQAVPKLTASVRPVMASLDSSGYLVDQTGNRGVWLVASDSVVGIGTFTWSITLQIQGITSRTITGVFLPRWNAAGDEVDLFDIVPADPNQPVFVGSDPLVAGLINDLDSKTRAAIIEVGGGGGTISGVTSVNGATGDITGIATTASLNAVSNAQANLAPKNNPSFTGTVIVPAATVPGAAVNLSQLNGITKTSLGLGSVDNTADADKPISTATNAKIVANQGGGGPLISGITWNASTSLTQYGTTLRITLNHIGTVVTLPTPPADLQTSITFILKQNATGGRGVVWPNNTIVLWNDGTPPTLTTTANAVDVVVLTWVGTYWIGTLAVKNAS